MTKFPVDAFANHRLITRTVIVRLGPQLAMHTEGNHASVGITGIAVEDGYLVVNSDFDGNIELTLSATANVDATLASKGVFAGASGGGSVTRFGIYSCRNLPYGSGQERAAFTLLPPNSAVFNSAIDNLWITLVSIAAT